MEYHILNGDCLKETLEDEYSNLLIMREALIQGPIEEKDETSFFEKRADFISEEYKACSKETYLKGLSEFEKIKAIEKNSIINLWFGKDVFCQVNFWFLLNLLKNKIDTNDFYLVLPNENQNCSFSNKEKREESFKKKITISKEDIKIFCNLWDLFTQKQYTKMRQEGEVLESNYPFILETIKAIINMQEVEKEFIHLSIQENDFKKLFQKISKEYSIYGYGDMQVMYIIGNSY